MLFYSQNLTFVFAFSLALALPSLPVRAMKEEKSHIETLSKKEDVLQKIEFYYQDLEEFLDKIGEYYFSLSQNSLTKKDPKRDIGPFLQVLKDGMVQENPKAKVLSLFAKIDERESQRGEDNENGNSNSSVSEGDSEIVAEWKEVFSWLSAQDDAISARWLAEFAQVEWEGHLPNLEEAIKWYKIAAGKGDIKAYSDLGILYFRGIDGSPIDLVKGEEYLLKAGDYCPLGAFYHHGLHRLEINLEKAKEYYLKAIENGNKFAYCSLAQLCWDNDDDVELETIEGYYLKAGEGGVAQAYISLGELYEFWLNDRQPEDLLKAEEYYLKAIENGETRAYYNLGQLYRMKPDAQPEDFLKAEGYYLKVMENGGVSAYTELAEMYLDGPDPLNWNKIEEYSFKAAKNGDSSIYIRLAERYHYGQYGQGVDLAKAEKYYLKAAENGNISTYITLARMYEHGWDGPKDLAKTEKYYLKAIENGDIKAYLDLIQLCYNEQWSQPLYLEKAKKYFLEAEECYLKAAKAGDIHAYCKLGDLYCAKQDKQPEDLLKAKKYYLKAAKKEESPSPYFHLAQLYQFNWQDRPLAPEKIVHWYLKGFRAPIREYDSISSESCLTSLKEYLRLYAFSTVSEGITVLTEVLPEDENFTNEWHANNSFLTESEESVVELEILPEDEILINKWQTTLKNLATLSGKMFWKHGELQNNFTKINNRNVKLNSEHYSQFGKILGDALEFWPKALDEDVFVCLKLNPSIKDHFHTLFKVHNPKEPVSSEEVGLRLYTLKPDTTEVFAFENENVKIGDKVVGTFDSLQILIKHHRDKRILLEKFLTIKQVKGEPDEQLLTFECNILKKSKQQFSWNNEDLKPTFSELLLATLKKKHDLSEDVAQQYMVNRMKEGGTAKNPSPINQCIDEEILKHINNKIQKRTDKIELLEGLITNFEKTLEYSYPKKIIKFKETYPDLDDILNN